MATQALSLRIREEILSFLMAFRTIGRKVFPHQLELRFLMLLDGKRGRFKTIHGMTTFTLLGQLPIVLIDMATGAFFIVRSKLKFILFMAFITALLNMLASQGKWRLIMLFQCIKGGFERCFVVASFTFAGELSIVFIAVAGETGLFGKYRF